ncbi:hypothetical protein JL721_9185 [Aureococcus anophagefferens]|nr:hypothetical protein JL721_9185 [Aureococcus anophagefferens]
MLSQFFVLSPRGDTIISKDFRGDSPQGAAEAFFRKVKFWSNDKGASGAAPPVFRVGDVTYVWVKKSGLMFACNSRFNCSPSMTLELLNRVVKNEIFVDILERLTMLFSPSGAVVNSTIDGCIQMKSYLSGNPELLLALNEDLVVGKGGAYDRGEFAVHDRRRRPRARGDPGDELRRERRHHRRARDDGGAPCSPPSGGAIGHGADYDAANRKLVFTVKKFQGGVEHAFARRSLSAVCTAQARKEVGPVSLTFEIPMSNVSNLQVKYLRIAEQSKAYNPYRWVRYVTRSSSYVCRC